MTLLGAILLVPNSLSARAISSESYFLFAAWSIAGFICFRLVLQQDQDRRFGRTAAAWVALLSVVLIASLTWATATLQDHTDQAVEQVGALVQSDAGTEDILSQLSLVGGELRMVAGRDMILVAVLLIASLGVMLSNFAVIQRREQESAQQLGEARTVANTDPLTGVKNKHAYVTREGELNELIELGELHDLAIVVCDVNGLKRVNDTLGHKAGDQYIRAACMLICNLFKHSPVFRIGGDEFVVILQDSDFEHRSELMDELERQSIDNMQQGKVVVAVGMAEFDPSADDKVVSVFERADTLMYQSKKALKELSGEPDSRR